MLNYSMINKTYVERLAAEMERVSPRNGHARLAYIGGDIGHGVRYVFHGSEVMLGSREATCFLLEAIFTYWEASEADPQRPEAPAEEFARTREWAKERMMARKHRLSRERGVAWARSCWTQIERHEFAPHVTNNIQTTLFHS